MANPAKAKGTRFENEVLELLRRVWPSADRAKAGNPSNDFHGIPFPVEAKHRKRWEIPKWVGGLRQVAGGDDRWALVVASGDRRSEGGSTVVVFDINFAMELLGCWENRRHSALVEMALADPETVEEAANS